VAVKKVKAKKQINYFLPMVERQLILPYVMTVLGGDTFKGAKGDTVNVKVTDGSIATARDYDFRGRTGPIVLDDIYQTGGNLPIKLTTHVVSATGLEDEHFTLDDIDFAREVLAPQVEAVVNRVEAKALSGFRNLHIHDDLNIDIDAGDDPHLVATEAKRRLDAKKVAPYSGRVFLIGTDVAAAWVASDRLSQYNSTGQEGTPALREAIIGRLSGSPVVVHNGLDPNEAYYMHSSGLVLGNAVPEVPRGAVTGNTGVGKRGIGARWIQDYDANYLRDRSIVSTFLGVNEIRDERTAAGDWMIEEGEFDDEDLAVMRNRDNSEVTPVPVGTRMNVRMVKLNVTGTGDVLNPTP
jgi:hypothetical protein